ncbi:MAG: hypothetical protein HW416_2751 [Chloroflexi bacterium]|nr:hypothetical protein [Chloroflexota bacterium]
MVTRAESAIARLRSERDTTLRSLSSLPEPACKLPARWAGTDRTVNFLLRMFTAHQMDHMQQLQKMLRDRQHTMTEPQLLLMRAQAIQGELEALVLGLSEDEFTQAGQNEDDWSVERLVEHVAEVERNYRTEILRAVEQARVSGGES